MLNSGVVICPIDFAPIAQAAGQLLGHDIGFAVRLSPSGQEPATHLGAHTWWRPEQSLVMLGQAYPDPMPSEITQYQIDNILSTIVVSVDANGLKKRPHFDYVINSEGLQVIEYEEA